MDRSLAPHIHAALHGRDLIVLDLTSGAYELFAGLGDQVSLSADRRVLRSAAADILGELDDLGLLAVQTTAGGRPTPRLPTRTALFAEPPPLPFSARLWVGRGWLGMLTRYHGRSFQDLLDAVRDRHLTPTRRDAVDLPHKAAVFDRLSVWLPFQGDCLYRCFMLLRLLGRDGAAVDWVFGVRTWPFLAHCWLQVGDLCLTDDAGRLRAFSPILVA